MTRRFIALLLAGAMLTVACSTSTSVTQPDDGASEPAGAVDTDVAEPTDLPEPTDVPEPTATPEPEPTKAPEPTPTPEPAQSEEADLDAATDRLANRFAADLSGAELSCVFSALGDNEEFAAAALNDSFESLPIDQQADLAALMFECAPQTTAATFSAELSIGAGAELPPEVSECLVDSMTTSPDRRNIIIGFIALGETKPVPDPSQDPLIDTMVACFPGTTLLEVGAADALSDPVFEDAMDSACLAEALDGEAMRPVWTALVTNPTADFEQLDPAAVAPMMNGMFSCMSFGRVIASEAAADGVELSEESVSCIDIELAELDFFSAMSDPAAEQEIGTAVLRCLTAEEAAQLGG